MALRGALPRLTAYRVDFGHAPTHRARPPVRNAAIDHLRKERVPADDRQVQCNGAFVETTTFTG